MNVYVEPNRNFTEEIKYVWQTFAFNKTIKINFVDRPEQADIITGTTADSHVPVATGFYDQIGKGLFGFSNFFKGDGWIRDEQGTTDYLTTAFYMLTGLQEYGAATTDEIGRFRFEGSYQYAFGTITQNLVQECFDRLVQELPPLTGLSYTPRKSQVFLSHDIDTVHGALLQDGYYLLRNFKLHRLWNVILNTVLQRPDWLNMDKIMQIEDEHSFKSTFFWLVNRGRINSWEVNADYTIQSNKIQSVIRRIDQKGWENGLHKSISADTLKEEMGKTGFSPVANRYHYLKFTLPALYDNLEESGLALDASLGFAEAYGFRNSYGLPFFPFNMKKRKKYSFLEVPLNVMDVTFQKYMKIPQEETAAEIIRFFEKNKYNCVLSVLWHNTFFTRYKFQGYLEVYKKVLAYLYESGYSSITPSEIITQYAAQQ